MQSDSLLKIWVSVTAWKEIISGPKITQGVKLRTLLLLWSTTPKELITHIRNISKKPSTQSYREGLSFCYAKTKNCYCFGLGTQRSCSGIIMIEDFCKPVLVHLVLNFLYNFIIIKNITCGIFWYIGLCIIWLPCKYFLGYFLLSMYTNGNLIFVLNHESYDLKIYGAFHFGDIQFYIIFKVKIG